MPFTLPAISRTEVKGDILGQLDALLCKYAASSFVVAEKPSATNVLFWLGGKAFSAGVFEEERFGVLPVSDFFGSLSQCRKIEVCDADLPLFLCAAVLFRKAPAAQIPSQLMDSQSLLSHVQQMGKDAVLVVRRAGARNLVFCREGEPIALYPAPGESFPAAGSVADRIIEYIYTDAAHPDVTLDLYDEVRLPPASDGGKPLSDYLAGHVNSPTVASWLLVRLGERVVFRFPITQEVFTVGRGAGNDLSLDNLSVSRRHARIRCKEGHLHVEDMGSENGLVIAGTRVTTAVLGVGDEVAVGKYNLLHLKYSNEQAPTEVRPRAATAPAVDETVAVPAFTKVGELEHNGQYVQIRSLLFTIGKKPSANLRIRGFWVAPHHVRLRRERDGRYLMQHIAGRERVKLNGSVVKEAHLKDGDEILIGKERLLFRLVEIR